MDFGKIENLVFEGGGVKGYAYVQILRELTLIDPNFLSYIKRYAGTSAGAMFASMVCLNFTIDEIENILVNISTLEILKKGKFGCNIFRYTKYLYKFWRTYGIADTTLLEKLVKKLFKSQWCKISFSSKDPTFIDIYNLLGKELVITSTNMNTNSLIYFTHTTTPNVPIYKAVMASSCFPGVFKPVKYNFNPQLGKKNCSYLLDGGLILNYPIFVFDHKNPYSAFEDGKYNEKTLGFLIMTQEEKHFKNKTLTKNIETPSAFVGNLVDILTKQLEKKIIKEQDWRRTIPIYVKNYSSTNMTLTPEMRVELVSSSKTSFALVMEKKDIFYSEITKY
jgi:NTE family protein